jgi:prepilin-type N-terminal cleavage/methylation domain-containing protein
MKRNARNLVRRAYTLVELVLVVAVMGIAGMLLVPNLIDRDTFAIQAAARTIISDIVFAQSDALANQEYRRVQFIEAPIGQSGYIGFCLVRVTPSTFSYPYDSETADYIFDPIASSSDDGRYIVDFTADDRFNGVLIESVDLDVGLDFITFDEFGGSISSSSGAPGTGGSVDLISKGHRYRVHVAPFTGKTTVEVLESP